jgi:hypothetical protein
MSRHTRSVSAESRLSTGQELSAKRRGPMRWGVPAAQIDEMVQRLRLLEGPTDLLLHDFDDPGRDELVGEAQRELPGFHCNLAQATILGQFCETRTCQLPKGIVSE